MISELSESGQYICTTFRPELIPHADSYFGVIFNATKISNVKTRMCSFSLFLVLRRPRCSPLARSSLTFGFSVFSTSPLHFSTVSSDECQEFIEGKLARICAQPDWLADLDLSLQPPSKFVVERGFGARFEAVFSSVLYKFFCCEFLSCPAAPLVGGESICQASLRSSSPKSSRRQRLRFEAGRLFPSRFLAPHHITLK